MREGQKQMQSAKEMGQSPERIYIYMEVSKARGTPRSSILIVFSIRDLKPSMEIPTHTYIYNYIYTSPYPNYNLIGGFEQLIVQKDVYLNVLGGTPQVSHIVVHHVFPVVIGPRNQTLVVTDLPTPIS
jgi:hypothetical protein